MRKIFSLIAAVLFAGSMMAQVTILPSDFTAVESSDYSTTKSGVTVAVTASTVTADQMRIFKNQTITISAESNITSIEFTCTANGTAKYGPGCFAAQDGYTFEASGKKGTWTGSANSVSFTASTNQVRATQIVVTLDGEVTPVTEYYLVGNFNSWQADEAYKLVANPGNAAEMMIKGVELEANDELKVIGILGETTTWYPDNADNYVVAAEGEYDIYFRADGQGGDDWYNGYFYLAQVLVPTSCAEASAAILALADNTYLLDQRQITLRGYVTEIAVDYSEDYHNVSFWMADEANGGQVIEAFRAACATAEDAPAVGDVVEVTGKMKKYVKNNVATPEFDAGCTFTILDDIHTAIENTNVEVKAVKFFENGQLFINKNGVIYNAQGAVVR